MVDISDERLDRAQTRAARIAVTSSSARGQPKGTIVAAQEYLCSSAFSLAELSGLQQSITFAKWLNGRTQELQKNLPSGSWGHARKFLNLFLYIAARDHALREAYDLDAIEPLLEIPVDSFVANGLASYAICAKHGENRPLRWNGIAAMTVSEHAQYQALASSAAAFLGLPRPELDMYLWRQNETALECLVCASETRRTTRKARKKLAN